VGQASAHSQIQWAHQWARLRNILPQHPASLIHSASQSVVHGMVLALLSQMLPLVIHSQIPQVVEVHSSPATHFLQPLPLGPVASHLLLEVICYRPPRMPMHSTMTRLDQAASLQDHQTMCSVLIYHHTQHLSFLAQIHSAHLATALVLQALALLLQALVLSLTCTRIVFHLHLQASNSSGIKVDLHFHPVAKNLKIHLRVQTSRYLARVQSGLEPLAIQLI